MTGSLPCKQVVCNVASIHKSHWDDGYLGHYYPGSHVCISLSHLSHWQSEATFKILYYFPIITLLRIIWISWKSLNIKQLLDLTTTTSITLHWHWIFLIKYFVFDHLIINIIIIKFNKKSSRPTREIFCWSDTWRVSVLSACRRLRLTSHQNLLYSPPGTPSCTTTTTPSTPATTPPTPTTPSTQPATTPPTTPTTLTTLPATTPSTASTT